MAQIKIYPSPYTGWFYRNGDLFQTGTNYNIVTKDTYLVSLISDLNIISDFAAFNVYVDGNDLPFVSVAQLVEYLTKVVRGLPLETPPALPISKLISNYVRTPIDENPLTNYKMNVDGSVTPVTFEYVMQADGFLNIFNVFIEDAGLAFSPENFGNLPKLTNGVDLKFEGQIVYNFKSNIEVVMSGDNASELTGLVAASRNLYVRSSSTSVLLDLGEKVEVIVNDDLTGLTNFLFRIGGQYL